MDVLEIAMSLITGAGDSKSYSMEAIEYAKDGKIKEARNLIRQATDAMIETHDMQTQLIRDEMSGKNATITLLMVHAQDHINMAMMMRDVATEFINLYEKILPIEGVEK